MIPYRGLPYSFPYLSATDVINNAVPKEAIKGKLIFLGSTASAIGDNRPGAIAPIFPGLEIHASIASGIIACFLNNTGIAFRAAGPTESLAFLSPFSKILATFWMLLGRLEFFVVLLLFIPSFWKNR